MLIIGHLIGVSGKHWDILRLYLAHIGEPPDFFWLLILLVVKKYRLYGLGWHAVIQAI